MDFDDYNTKLYLFKADRYVVIGSTEISNISDIVTAEGLVNIYNWKSFKKKQFLKLLKLRIWLIVGIGPQATLSYKYHPSSIRIGEKNTYKFENQNFETINSESYSLGYISDKNT